MRPASVSKEKFEPDSIAISATALGGPNAPKQSQDCWPGQSGKSRRETAELARMLCARSFTESEHS